MVKLYRSGELVNSLLRFLFPFLFCVHTSCVCEYVCVCVHAHKQSVCFFTLSCLTYSYALLILNPCRLRHPGQLSPSPPSRSCSPHFIHCLTCHSLPGQLSACSKWLWHLRTQATGTEWERGTWYTPCQQRLFDWIVWEIVCFFCSGRFTFSKHQTCSC